MKTDPRKRITKNSSKPLTTPSPQLFVQKRRRTKPATMSQHYHDEDEHVPTELELLRAQLEEKDRIMADLQQQFQALQVSKAAPLQGRLFGGEANQPVAVTTESRERPPHFERSQTARHDDFDFKNLDKAMPKFDGAGSCDPCTWLIQFDNLLAARGRHTDPLQSAILFRRHMKPGSYAEAWSQLHLLDSYNELRAAFRSEFFNKDYVAQLREQLQSPQGNQEHRMFFVKRQNAIQRFESVTSTNGLPAVIKIGYLEMGAHPDLVAFVRRSHRKVTDMLGEPTDDTMQKALYDAVVRRISSRISELPKQRTNTVHVLAVHGSNPSSVSTGSHDALTPTPPNTATSAVDPYCVAEAWPFVIFKDVVRVHVPGDYWSNVCPRCGWFHRVVPGAYCKLRTLPKFLLDRFEAAKKAEKVAPELPPIRYKDTYQRGGRDAPKN